MPSTQIKVAARYAEALAHPAMRVTMDVTIDGVEHKTTVDLREIPTGWEPYDQDWLPADFLEKVEPLELDVMASLFEEMVTVAEDFILHQHEGHLDP